MTRLSKGHRLLLEVVEQSGGGASWTKLTKCMFLLSRETRWGREACPYEFVPYRYGPFSFLAARDKDALCAAGVVSDDGGALRLSQARVGDLPEARPAVEEIMSRYGRKPTEWLIAYTYRTYPFWAALSDRGDLTAPRHRLPQADPAAYTIGYSRRTIDGFLLRLLEKGVSGVVDVRRVPASRVYGFHKTTLRKHLGRLGLSYYPRPHLGIPSEQRRGIGAGRARRALLDDYRRRARAEAMSDVRELARLMAERPLALMCAERHASDCHRGELATLIAGEGSLRVVHL